MSSGIETAWIKVRPLVLVFAGGDIQNLVVNSAQVVEQAFERSGASALSKRIQELSCPGDKSSDPVDVLIAYRLSGTPTSDVLYAAKLAPLGALTMAVGDWHWDKMPSGLEKKVPEERTFVENTSRFVLVYAYCDVPIMQLVETPFNKEGKQQHLNLWTSDLQDLKVHTDAAIRQLYRCEANNPIPPNLAHSPDAEEQRRREELAQKLGCPAHGYMRSGRWKAVERLLSTSLPLDRNLHVRAVLSGRSGAAAIQIGANGKSPYIAKIGSPFAMGQELRGFLGVILPKLQNYVSRPLLLRHGMNGLLLTGFDDAGTTGTTSSKQQLGAPKTLGLTLLSAVGEPGEVKDLQSLNKMLGKAFADPAEHAEKALKCLDSTLKGMIGKLHAGAKARGSTIWRSYGSNLPAWFELSTDAPEEPSTHQMSTTLEYVTGGDERGMLAHDALQLAALQEEVKDAATSIVKMRRMALFQIQTDESGGKIELTHPRLGIRLAIASRPVANENSRGDLAASLAKQAWVRRGHYADASAWLAPRGGMKFFREAAIAYRSLFPGAPQWCPLEVFGGIRLENIDGVDQEPNIPGELATALLDVNFPTAMGTIHGDLNLDNLQFSGDSELGWMIDFERSVEDGPVAFDYAKLQVELALHHGISEAIRVSGAYRNHATNDANWHAKVQKDVITLFKQVFDHLDHQPNSDVIEFLKARYPLPIDSKAENSLPLVAALHADDGGKGYSGKLSLLLRALANIQTRAIELLELAHGKPRQEAELTGNLARADLAMARAAYAFAAIKHASKDSPSEPEKATCLFGISNSSLRIALGSRTFNETAALSPDAWLRDRDLATSWLMHHKLPGASVNASMLLSHLTRIAGVSTVTKPLFDPSDGNEYWDVASTGGIGNLSPIVGFLLLMARREQQNGAQNLFVAKICSRGTGGGTQDTLEAGGYILHTDKRNIVDAVKNEFGCFVGQDKKLVPADTALMAKRKDLGLMKSAELALASILGKKLPLGSRHIVIDVKLGADSKMLPRLPFALVKPRRKAVESVRIAREALLLENPGDSVQSLHISPEQVPNLDGYLHALLEPDKDPESATTRPMSMMHQAKGPGDEQEQHVRLLYSNGDKPQCRAVGRLLLLEQLERLFVAGDWADLPEYKDFYFKHLAVACGWDESKSPHEIQILAAAEWEKLKTKLPRFSSSDQDLACIREATSKSEKLTSGGKRDYSANELKPLTFRFSDVPAWTAFGSDRSLLLAHVNVNPLDALFKDLTPRPGAHDTDPGIGFWLHTLPGESICTAPASSPILISAFVRKGVDEDDIKARVVDYLIRNWRWEEARLSGST